MQARHDVSEPFLRWAGGKRQLSGEIASYFPPTFGTYFEPFLGSGAVFFKTCPSRATLSDVNPDLVVTFQVVRDDPRGLLRWLSRHKEGKAHYYKVRELRPRTEIGIAGRLIYLNRTSFNGIWRVNQEGAYNVPYGGRSLRRGSLRHQIEGASRALHNTKVIHCDFSDALASARPQDLVYLDPPYTVRHSQNGFRKYNEKLFQWEDQCRLAAVAQALASRGAHVVVSNSPHPSLRSLYSDFRRITLRRSSSISAMSSARGPVSESLYVSS